MVETALSRIGDSLIIGLMVSGSSNVLANNIGICRIGDTYSPPTGVTLIGSPSVFSNNIACCGVGHTATAPGLSLVSGSPNVFIEK